MLYAQKDNASSLPFRMYRAVRMQPTGRLYAAAGAFVVFVVLSVVYLSGAPEYNRGGFNLTSINVKVLPGALSDEQLAKLDKSSFNYLAMIDAGSSGCRAHVYRYGRLDRYVCVF